MHLRVKRSGATSQKWSIHESTTERGKALVWSAIVRKSLFTSFRLEYHKIISLNNTSKQIVSSHEYTILFYLHLSLRETKIESGEEIVLLQIIPYIYASTNCRLERVVTYTCRLAHEPALFLSEMTITVGELAKSSHLPC